MGRRIRNPTFLGWALLAAAILVAAAMVFRLERGLTFGWDELVWIEIGGLSEFEAFIRPYGGHLILTPYLIFRGTMDLFGISFTAFAVIQVVGLSLVALLLYVYSRRRVGPILALAPAVVILFLGGAYPVLFEPMIGIQFLAAIAPGLAAIVVLEREDLAGDLAACLFLCLALAGFSEGAIFLAGAVASIAVSRNWKRRLWVVVVPLLGYLYWRHYASQFETVGVIGSNIPPLPSYFVDALAVYASAVFGRPGPGGRDRPVQQLAPVRLPVRPAQRRRRDPPDRDDHGLPRLPLGPPARRPAADDRAAAGDAGRALRRARRDPRSRPHRRRAALPLRRRADPAAGRGRAGPRPEGDADDGRRRLRPHRGGGGRQPRPRPRRAHHAARIQRLLEGRHDGDRARRRRRRSVLHPQPGSGPGRPRLPDPQHRPLAGRRRQVQLGRLLGPRAARTGRGRPRPGRPRRQAGAAAAAGAGRGCGGARLPRGRPRRRRHQLRAPARWRRAAPARARP